MDLKIHSSPTEDDPGLISTCDLPDDDGSHRSTVKSLPVYAETLTSPVLPGARGSLLVVVRESDAHDWVQMEGMAAQTYAGLMGNPIADAIARAGITPMHGKEFDLDVDLGAPGGQVTVTVVPEVRRHGKTKAVLFRVGQTYHLWCMASAASVSDASKINAWNQIVMDVIREVRPVQLHVATVSRLVRSHRQALLLQEAMTDNVDFLTFSGMRLDFVGHQFAVGHMMLTVLGMMAAQERDWIMQRLMAGRVALFKRGLWQYGLSFVPFGYRYDKATRTLMIDPSTAKIVPKMIDILLSDASMRRKQLDLSAIGVTMRRHSRVDPQAGGAYLPLSHAHNASMAVDQLLLSASIWVHGQYVTRLKNPGLSYDHIAGVPIVREHERDSGELQMVSDLPVPEGGWGSPEQLAALWQLALKREAKLTNAGAGHRRLSPELCAKYAHLDIATLAQGTARTSEADLSRGPRRGGRRRR